MRSLAGSSVALVIGAFEVGDACVWMTNIEPHLMPAICTIENIAEHILLSQFLVRRAALCLGDMRLHPLKGVTADDRLVNVLENLPF